MTDAEKIRQQEALLREQSETNHRALALCRDQLRLAEVQSKAIRHVMDRVEATSPSLANELNAWLNEHYGKAKAEAESR